MELLGREMPVVQRPVTEDEIGAAREMLVLGTTFDCTAIVSYEGRPVGNGKPGPVAARVLELLRADLLDNGTPYPLSGGNAGR